MTSNRSLDQNEREEGSLAGAVLTLLGAAGVAAATAWIVYSHLAVDHEMPLPDAIRPEWDGTARESMQGPAGRTSFYADRKGQGRPLVLVHSINAAASAYEMSPLFHAYRGRRPVFAPDLPGFGFSDRPKRSYSPQVYIDSLLAFLDRQIGEPADVVALSLSGEFATRAALQRPDLFHSLALISPTGFSSKSGGDKGSQQAGQSGLSRVLYPLFSFPVWARAFYDLLTTRGVIRYFLEKSFISPVPVDLIEYDYLTAHQPGAEHAPLHFISGLLFTPQVRTRIYEQVKTPTMVVYDRDGFTSFDMLPGFLASNPNWSAMRIIPTLGLPQFEQLAELVTVLDRFWERL